RTCTYGAPSWVAVAFGHLLVRDQVHACVPSWSSRVISSPRHTGAEWVLTASGTAGSSDCSTSWTSGPNIPWMIAKVLSRSGRDAIGSRTSAGAGRPMQDGAA